jgi:hypothetical protein
MMKNALIAATLAAFSGAACAQVVINEVYENPVGGGAQSDAFTEFVELYGEPGMSLNGYAIGLLKGGTDINDDGVPESTPEIDEAFRLDGLSLDSRGFLVLHNNTNGAGIVPFFLPPGAAQSSFQLAHIPTSDTPGNLANDDSSTYLLVRRRVTGGTLPFGTNFRKDVAHDIDFDGKIDVGNEGPGALAMDPLQIIDEAAWSDNGGKEYVRSSEQEISDTPGFNPDAISRVEYYGQNPLRGLRINSQGQTVPTRMADEEWIYGETTDQATFFAYSIAVNTPPTPNAPPGAPTDPAGDGFQDINAVGFDLTPGDFNDDAAPAITQFRFIRGDVNFDKVVDCDDIALAETFIGRSFDETADFIDPDTGTTVPNPFGPGNVQSYVFQGRLANGFLAATNMVKTDGSGGANAATVTAADVAAIDALVTIPCCPVDLTGDGQVDSGDLSAFITAFLTQNPIADLTGDGQVDSGDLSFFITGFLNPAAVGC